MKKILSSLSMFAFIFGVFGTNISSVQAACPAKDLDRDYYYDAGADGTGDPCATDKPIGFKGYEKTVCDCPILRVGEKCGDAVIDAAFLAPLFDSDKITRTLRGKSFNPKAVDSPGDGIDQNCDGFDETRVGSDDESNIADIIQRGVEFLGTIVAGVSTLFLIWGAVLFASASGDEEKTRKAKKTMVGAIIGLIIGILASQLIGIVIGNVA